MRKWIRSILLVIGFVGVFFFILITCCMIPVSNTLLSKEGQLIDVRLEGEGAAADLVLRFKEDERVFYINRAPASLSNPHNMVAFLQSKSVLVYYIPRLINPPSIHIVKLETKNGEVLFDESKLPQ